MSEFCPMLASSSLVPTVDRDGQRWYSSPRRSSRHEDGRRPLVDLLATSPGRERREIVVGTAQLLGLDPTVLEDQVDQDLDRRRP